MEVKNGRLRQGSNQSCNDKKSIQLHLVRTTRFGQDKKIELTAAELGLKEGKDYVIAPTYLTETKLYKFISDNIGKVIILDDCGPLFKKTNAVKAFKDAFWKNGTHKRVIKYWSYFKDKDFPDEIDVDNTYFILTYNNIRIDPDIDAVLSRTLPRAEINYSFEERKQLMLQYAKEKGEDYPEVAEEILKHLTKFNKVDFRMLEHARSFKQSNPENWRILVKQMLDIGVYENKVVKLFRNIYGDNGYATTLELKKLVSINFNVGLRQAEKLIKEAIDACLLVKIDDRQRGYLIGLALDPEKVWEAKIEEEEKERYEKAQEIIRKTEERAAKVEWIMEETIPREYLEMAENWMLDSKNKHIVTAAEQFNKKNELKRYVAKEFKEGRVPDEFDIFAHFTQDKPLEESVKDERMAEQDEMRG